MVQPTTNMWVRRRGVIPTLTLKPQEAKRVKRGRKAKESEGEMKKGVGNSGRRSWELLGAGAGVAFRSSSSRAASSSVD
jgi:hypothetical protein